MRADVGSSVTIVIYLFFPTSVKKKINSKCSIIIKDLLLTRKGLGHFCERLYYFNKMNETKLCLTKCIILNLFKIITCLSYLTSCSLLH